MVIIIIMMLKKMIIMMMMSRRVVCDTCLTSSCPECWVAVVSQSGASGDKTVSELFSGNN